MVKKYVVMLLALAFILTGCYSKGGWSPTVDPYGDPNAANIERDRIECRQLAEQASGNTAAEAGKGALVGGLIGAAGGAVIGAATGSPGTGAIVGTAAGGVAGAAKQGFEAEGTFKDAFRNCMAGRGHKVLN